MQKTKNNKILPKAASEEYDIIDFPGRYDLAYEIYTLAHETQKSSKQKPKKTTEKTPNTTIKGGKMEREWRREKR
jgi:hypothetical protein